MDKLYCIKIQNFCSAKDTVERMKKISHRLGENICKKYILIRNLYSKYTGAQQLTRRKKLIKTWASRAPVAHTYNPSYSGGRDQEDCGLKPAWANSS
jgi:hypothetical protein